MSDAETRRLERDAERLENWKRWGPYLAERQWGTVREDYSSDGDCWEYFPHDHARSRVYRWGEDGLLGFTDRQCRLCFSVALWNERDPILKERLFGLTGPEGNHGEDVKECYYYLDSTPTHSYAKALYKYPQAAFPYEELVAENRRRTRADPEFELTDTGVFDESRYFDVFAEYAKASPDDILIRLTIANRGPVAARIAVLPTLWFRNVWSWGRVGEGYGPRPQLERVGDGVLAQNVGLGDFRFDAEPVAAAPEWLFTENETNVARLYRAPNQYAFVKDAFHEYVVAGRRDAVNPAQVGTKVAALYWLTLEPGAEVRIRLRLRPSEVTGDPFGSGFDRVFDTRISEAEQFYQNHLPAQVTPDEKAVLRQGYAGLLWSKQFYHYVVNDWLEGDPAQPPPPEARKRGRNREWVHVFNRDVISMPDKWEYPWFAAWDLAFHMIPFARIDPQFAKEQLILLLREWYTHPNGQIPAYEFAFSDVNPPVHAWAVWRVYKMTGARGKRDRPFLERAFHKLLLNFTWWVNRKDPEGRNLFAGGFLGLDNIGAFDRSRQLPAGGHLEQADGTAWMAFYCNTMLSIALELACEDPAYEDVASKFFEHFIAIADAINTLGGTGLWVEDDGFYYDQLHVDGTTLSLRERSLVGVIPLIAVEVLDDARINKLHGFRKRMDWFLVNRPDLARHISCMPSRVASSGANRLLAIPSRGRLARLLRYVLDEAEFLGSHGVRSLSRVHRDHPYVFDVMGERYEVDYVPGESNSGLFGGNSNWRGPIWFPINFLVLEALERYGHFYGETLTVECPVGSGRMLTLEAAAREIEHRLATIFLPGPDGRRPCHGDDQRYAADPHWKDLVLFHEYFHGETGRGIGASHQTGWTALVLHCIEDLARARSSSPQAQQERRPALTGT